MTATEKHNGILGGDFDAKALDHAQSLHEYVQAAVRKGYAEGFEAGRKHELVGAEFDKQMEKVAALPAEDRSHAMTAGFREIYGGEEALKGVAESFVSAPEVKSAQDQRDEIVERAKADVENLTNRMVSNNEESIGNSTFNSRKTIPEFIVNREKRLIVVNVNGAITDRLFERGFAKCASNDCFNVHIGKAIALRRALGLDVPAEYLNAPQPTEVRVGDVVGYPFSPSGLDADTVVEIDLETGLFQYKESGFDGISILFEDDEDGPQWDARIIDDSRETEAVD